MADPKCSWAMRVPGLVLAAAFGYVTTSYAHRAYDLYETRRGPDDNGGTGERRDRRPNYVAIGASALGAATAALAAHRIMTTGARALLGPPPASGPITTRPRRYLSGCAGA